MQLSLYLTLLMILSYLAVGDCTACSKLTRYVVQRCSIAGKQFYVTFSLLKRYRKNNFFLILIKTKKITQVLVINFMRVCVSSN